MVRTSLSSRPARKGARLTEQVLVRLDDELHSALVREQARTGEDLAEVARRHIRSSITGDETAHRIERIEERLERLHELLGTLVEVSFPESVASIQDRIGLVGREVAQTGEQVAGLGSLFRQGFEKLATAFLKLQNFLEGAEVKK